MMTSGSVARQRRHRLLPSLLLLICGTICGVSCSSPATVSGPLPTAAHVSLGAAGTDTISVVFAIRGEEGRQAPYQRREGDRIDRDEEGNDWLVRDNETAGALVGPGGNILAPFDRLPGEDISGRLLDTRESYLLSSRDDPAYSSGLAPVSVYRKSRPTDLLRVSRERLEAPREHTLYLRFPHLLREGASYRLTFRDERLPGVSFIWQPRRMISEAVHVSQIGFRPDDPVKMAFLSLWMGSGGGMVFREGTPFTVIEQGTEKEVLQGKIQLLKGAGDHDEDAYGKNYNGADVFGLDFSGLRSGGFYRLYVEGIGCSYPFEIGAGVWGKAFNVSARGFYHQRSGIALGPPWTTYLRPRNMHPGDGKKIYQSTTPLMATTNGFLSAGPEPFSRLLAGRTDETLPEAWGGYSDAGDWDRRIQHLEGARRLLDLALLFPDYFSRLSLNIPETKDDLPDIVNEALWGIDFFRRLQDVNGGIRGGVESSRHPRYGETSWQETSTLMAYASDVWSSFLYAGTAARAAFWFRGPGRNPQGGEAYAESARRAAEWAETIFQGKPGESWAPEVRDARNLAAAELFRLTGAAGWNRVFVETTVFRNTSQPLVWHGHHDQSEAAWVYARTVGRGVDPLLQRRCRNAILEEAAIRLAAQEAAAFKWAKNPWRPAVAGAFTTPDALCLIFAHVLTGEEEYLRAVVLAAQTGAGANPRNMCYTTGIGHTNPRHVLHFDSRFSGQLPPAGITVFGPLDPNWSGGGKNREHAEAGKYCYPEAEKWPVLENYWDVFWHPLMCEFTIHQTIAPNAFTWGYLAARRGQVSGRQAPRHDTRRHTGQISSPRKRR